MAPQLDIGTLMASVDANTSPFERAMLRAQGVTTIAAKNIERDTKRAADSSQRLNKDFRVAAGGAIALGAAIKLIKIPALLSVVQPAVQGIEALSAGAVIAANSVKGLEGAAGALAPALVGGAVAVGALTLGLKGVSEAAGAYSSGTAEDIKKATEGMSEKTRGFAAQIAALKPELESLKESASSKLIDGLSVGLRSATDVLPTLRKELAETGGVLGEVGKNFGDYFGGTEFKQNFTKAMRDAKPLLSAVGDAMLNVGRAFMVVAASASPVTRAFTKWIRDLGEFVERSTRAGASSGRLTKYFERAVGRMKQWGNILENLGRTIARVFRGADTQSGNFLDYLESATMRLRLMTASGSKLQKYFADAAVPLKEMGRLIGDVFKVLTGFGSEGNRFSALTSLAVALRTNLLPALESLVKGVGDGAINAFVNLAAAVARFIGASNFQVIINVANAFAELANAALLLIQKIPGLSTALSYIALLGLGLKVLKLSSLVIGFTGITTALKGFTAGFKGAAASMAVYNTAAGSTIAVNRALAASQVGAAASGGRFSKVNAGLSAGFAALGGKTKFFLKGLAVAGPALAVTAVGAKAVNDKFDRMGSSTDRAAKRISEMNSAVTSQDGIIGKNTAAWDELAQSIGYVYSDSNLVKFYNGFEEIFSGGGIIAGLFGTKTALDAAKTSLSDYAKVMADMVTNGRLNEVLMFLERVDPLYKAYGESAWQAALEQKEFKDAVLATYGTLDLYEVKALAAEDANKRMKQSLIDAKMAMFDVADASAAANGVWGDSTREQMNFQLAVENAVGAIKAYGDAQVATGSYTVEAANNITSMADSLLNTKNMTDEARTAAYEYLKEIGYIPKSILTTIYLKAQIDPSVYEALRLAGLSDEQIANASGELAADIATADAIATRKAKERTIAANQAIAAYEAEDARLRKVQSQNQRKAEEAAAAARAAADEARRKAEEEAQRRAEEAKRRAEERKAAMKDLARTVNFVLPKIDSTGPEKMFEYISSIMQKLEVLANLPGKGGEKTLKWARERVKEYNRLLREYDKIMDKIADAKDKVRELKDERDAYAAEVKNVITSFGSIKDVLQEKNDTGDSLANVFKRRLQVTRDFVEKIKKLRKAGLNDTAIQEIIAEGPVAGGQYADAILQDKGAVKVINANQKELDKIGGSFGNTLANEFYGAGIKAAEGVVKGLQSQKAKLEDAMQTIADALVKGIKKALGIKSPSKVFADIAKYIPIGMAKGISENQRFAERAAIRSAKETALASRNALEKQKPVSKTWYEDFDLEKYSRIFNDLRAQGKLTSQPVNAPERVGQPSSTSKPSVVIERVDFAPVIQGHNLTTEQLQMLLEKVNSDFIKKLLAEIEAQ